MACAVLGGSGFVGAGYVSATTPSPAGLAAVSVRPADPGALDGSVVAAHVTIRFADTLVIGRKPAPAPLIDLAGPDGWVPPGDSVLAMRGDVPELPAALVSKVRREILAAAYQGLGHAYVWGGTSFANGWDCSGFVQWAYGQAGILLPRTEQWEPMVQTSSPQPGDLVAQNPDGPHHWSHVGIYVGDGRMISALNPTVGTILAPTASTGVSTYFTLPEFAADDAKAAASARGSTKASVTATTPTHKPTPSKTATPSPTPTKTATPSPTPTKTATPTPTKTATPSPTPSPTPTPTKTATPSPTATATTRSATASPTGTATPSAEPTQSAAGPTPTPTS
ncbi:C40 family peptidase [Specibacter cremeus]|uniref:C40 family peptidase n=1 Tax=Specibacter cremeus TaxID=1629051 RepID=UPI001F0B9444|nr:C40 family peptidase [Specibacter cremeus]